MNVIQPWQLLVLFQHRSNSVLWRGSPGLVHSSRERSRAAPPTE